MRDSPASRAQDRPVHPASVKLPDDGAADLGCELQQRHTDTLITINISPATCPIYVTGANTFAFATSYIGALTAGTTVATANGSNAYNFTASITFPPGRMAAPYAAQHWRRRPCRTAAYTS